MSDIRLGVVSDTHGHVRNTMAAVRMLESLEVDLVIHCGDIGSPQVVEKFAPWPTHYVFGNVDDEPRLQEAIEQVGHYCYGRFGALEQAGRQIAWLHSDDARRFQETLDGQQWDLVCFGHTHKADQYYQGKTLVLNPGALYRAARHTIALVELPALSAHIIPVDT